MVGTGGFPRTALETSLPARFASIVARFPDQIAVRGADATFTYQELDERSDPIAAGILAARGNAAEPIGLLLPQSAALCLAILGVLKSGKFYVPMDPSHPSSRNARVIQDAGIPLIIDEPTLAGLLARPGSRVRPEIRPDSYAYIYYTSGSTGHPKGVVDTHRNVLHNVLRYSDNLAITPEDRLTLLQGPAFSGAVSSLFCGLLNGATVCPYDLQRSGAGVRLADWVRDNQITIYHSVPAIFRSMAASGDRFPSVRIIRLEGDAASRTDVELLRAHFGPQCRIAHGLGATETGLSRQYFVAQDTPLPTGLIPLGFGTADMQASILDDDGSPSEPGAIGEIAIRSRYLAVGYWNQPEMTRAAFAPSPEGNGERLYRTGDLGRLGPDGCLEYLGRKTTGFKIRGNRVEPAELENALLALEGVRAACVVGRPGSGGEIQVVAYLVPSSGTVPSTGQLRETLRDSLPEYLVPSRFVVLDQLPTSENGKVDRGALPWPPPGEAARPGYVAADDRLEQQLVTLWEEAFQTVPIGVRDDFFDLGGDSLRAGMMHPALEEIAGRELSPAIMLTASTIERLAAAIRSGRSAHDPVLVPITTKGNAVPVFCIPEHTGQVGIGFAGLGRHLGDSRPFYALQAVGISGGEPPLPTIATMAARYREAIRSVQPHGPYALAGRCFGAVVALELAHQLVSAGEAVSQLFFIDVTPEDFPGLVPDSVRRRFRIHRWRERIREELPNIRQRKIWKRGPYVIRELGLALLKRSKSLRIRARIARGDTLPRNHWDVGLVSREAFALHRSRPWPGRITLLLREGDRARYGDALTVWTGLAQAGCDIHYLPGPARQFQEPEQTRRVAELLRAALAGTSRHDEFSRPD